MKTLNVKRLTFNLLLALLYLEAVRWLAGAPFSFAGVLERFGFIAAALAAGWLLGRGGRWVFGGWLAMGAAWVAYAATLSTATAWAALAGWFGGLLWVDAVVTKRITGFWLTMNPTHGSPPVGNRRLVLPNPLKRVFQRQAVDSSTAGAGDAEDVHHRAGGDVAPESPHPLQRVGRGLVRWATHLALAGWAGGVPVLVAQIEGRFSDEEFFVALQAAALAGLWLVLRFSAGGMNFSEDRRKAGKGIWGWAIGYLAISTGLLILAIRSYQASFYPPTAPTFPGIGAENPFLCGLSQPARQIYDAGETYARLLAAVEANPRKAAPEYAVLALGRSDETLANLFRETLLDEAAAGLFTGAAGSVKSSQYEAALRVYFYARMREHFPSLLTVEEQNTLRQWFAAINRRALTTEWVDWMYALAFAQWPHGPYENQENGAGLLALLESENLADPALSAANRAYLAANPRGWAQRFRVTDDAAVYQPEWIHNALFQTAYSGGQYNAEFLRLSFEWLLLQAPPSGAPLRYNHLGAVEFAGVGALGAALTGDGRYTWLAGRALDDLEQSGRWLSAAPGMEIPFQPTAVSPRSGSCLLFGDSGLPNQIGPLAPDKLVFRNGWAPDSLYLLLDLRFSGWHRYKATGALVQLSAGEMLIAEQTRGETFWWLPKGKSLFRDKRIPRENLNGLVIAGRGLSAALYTLSGVGSAWAQDPPYYAAVTSFETGGAAEVAEIVVEGWGGWTQTRTMYFYHNGLVVIVEDASGPAGDAAAVMWHAVGGSVAGAGRYRLGAGAPPAEMLLLPLTPGEIADAPEEGGLHVSFSGQGELRLATVFLTGEWVGAAARVEAGRLVIEAGELEAVVEIDR